MIALLTVGISIYAWQKEGVLYKLVLDPYQVIKRKEYYRFLTSGFVHADWMHLIFNMLSFVSFGFAMEHYYGYYFGDNASILFLLLYITGIIVSDIPTFLKKKNDQRFRSLGASGGVSAIIFASILFNPIDKITVFIIPVPGFIFGGLYLWYCAYLSKRSIDNINHDAHFYGALYGIAFNIVLFPQLHLASNFIEQVLQYKLF
jgi:membrane associated rhomboid family serine protease